jgi:DNA-3-methyladenine glycosylase
VVEAARALLGVRLVRDAGPLAGPPGAPDAVRLATPRIGRIVEVEAYGGPDDRASHARFGRNAPTARNAVMFGPPGIAYVYLVYGMYDCLNVVTGPEWSASAVLIRAVEPLDGVDSMRASRAAHRGRLGARVDDVRLASGPGLVAAAFGLDRSWTGTDLCDPAAALRLEPADAGDPPVTTITSSPRVGVAYAGEEWASRPWRFAIAGHASVSRPIPG